MSDGAMIVQDGRVSKFIGWVVGVVGSICISLGGIGVVTLVALRDDVRDLKSTVGFMNQANNERSTRAEIRLDSLEERTNDINGRVYTLEGRNLRGGPELHRAR